MNELNKRLSLLEKIGTAKYFENEIQFEKWFQNQHELFYNNNNKEVFDIVLMRMSQSDFLGEKDIWRIVEYPDNKKEHVKDLLPPFQNPELVTLQRCNYPFKPVFYGSVNLLGCFTEKFQNNYLEKEPKNLVLSRFIIKSPHKYTVINTPDYSSLDIFNSIYNEVKRLYSFDYDITELEKVTNIIAKEFLRQDDYTISAFISECFLHNKKFENEVILYPSVKNKYSFNLAINMNFIVSNINSELTGNIELVEAIDIDLEYFNIDENGNGELRFKTNCLYHRNNNNELTIMNRDKETVCYNISNYHISSLK